MRHPPKRTCTDRACPADLKRRLRLRPKPGSHSLLRAPQVRGQIRLARPGPAPEWPGARAEPLLVSFTDHVPQLRDVLGADVTTEPRRQRKRKVHPDDY